MVLYGEIVKNIRSCKKCKLHKTCEGPVPGHGDKKADIMVIGEAPGYNEDKIGKPFVGKSGRVLDEMLHSINLDKDDIYTTNTVKCKPPNNRNPTLEEIDKCSKHLDREIEEVNPKVIIPLGRFAINFTKNKFNIKNDMLPIAKSHGKIFDVIGVNTKIIPMYHPAYSLYNPGVKETIKNDFERVSDSI